MTSPRRTQVAALLIAVGATLALAGCGDATQGTPPESSTSPSSTATTAAAPATNYDITRVDTVKDDFPAGFDAQTEPEKTLQQSDIDNSGIAAFTHATVDPPQCRALLIPPYADPSVGTHAAGIRAEGEQGGIYVVALQRPQPVPAGPPPAGCDHATLSGSPEATGTMQSVPAPAIAGATTTGAQLSADTGDDPDYVYTAALDDRTSVIVMGSADADLNPQQVMSDLLVKAAAAVRGQ